MEAGSTSAADCLQAGGFLRKCDHVPDCSAILLNCCYSVTAEERILDFFSHLLWLSFFYFLINNSCLSFFHIIWKQLQVKSYTYPLLISHVWGTMTQTHSVHASSRARPWHPSCCSTWTLSLSCSWFRAAGYKSTATSIYWGLQCWDVCHCYFSINERQKWTVRTRALLRREVQWSFFSSKTLQLFFLQQGQQTSIVSYGYHREQPVEDWQEVSCGFLPLRS